MKLDFIKKKTNVSEVNAKEDQSRSWCKSMKSQTLQ